MSRIDELAHRYGQHIAIPWQRTLAGAQRVIMVVYEKELERNFRAKKGEFQQRTIGAGHTWFECDLTTAFATWMAVDEYREAYFESPEDIQMKLEDEFKASIVESIKFALKQAGEHGVVGVIGAASLFGFTRLSDVIRAVEPDIEGRLVVFFPGHKDGTNYRLLDARDGWNYLAVGITRQPEGVMA